MAIQLLTPVPRNKYTTTRSVKSSRKRAITSGNDVDKNSKNSKNNNDKNNSRHLQSKNVMILMLAVIPLLSFIQIRQSFSDTMFSTLYNNHNNDYYSYENIFEQPKTSTTTTSTAAMRLKQHDNSRQLTATTTTTTPTTPNMKSTNDKNQSSISKITKYHLINQSSNKKQHDLSMRSSLHDKCQTLENEWKQSSFERVLNYNESGITHDLAKQMITNNVIDHMDFVLGQTICHPEGRFRSTESSILSTYDDSTRTTPSPPPFGYWNVSNEALIHDWEFRLMYLAIHSFMHEPAYDEYTERKEACGDDKMKEKFPPYDYQCKSAKFIVAALPNEGLGATIRISGVMNVLMGLATDRIPLFVSNLPSLDDENKTFLEQPWNLASCPRKDIQCVFLPTTPCTLTMEDWKNATVLDEGDARGIKRRGELRPEFEDVRVLIHVPITAPAKADTFKGNHEKVRKKLHRKAKEIITQLETSHRDNLGQEQRNVLHHAAERILQADLPDSYEHYQYGHRYYRVAHAILFYLLRPNIGSKQKISETIQRVIPPSSNYYTDPSSFTLGIPIRGSDKCKRESTCLGFDKYMKLAEESWMEEQKQQQLRLDGSSSTTVTPPSRGTLIMTTEDESMFQQRLLYNASNGFPLDFIVNEQDVMQGTGSTRSYGTDADNIMISSMIAIQMQLYASHVYGNCCSNFHLVLFDFVREGCGLGSSTRAAAAATSLLPSKKTSMMTTCLQETEKYHVCCGWTRTEECNLLREEFQMEQKKRRV